MSLQLQLQHGLEMKYNQTPIQRHCLYTAIDGCVSMMAVIQNNL
jgi:hypothetical protein